MPNYWPIGGGGVTSFNGRTGAVVPQAGDYTAAQVTNAVDKTQAYADPSWISSLAFSKLTGVPSNFGLWQKSAFPVGGIYYSGGNVGVGVAAPWSLLHVRASASGVSGPFTADSVIFAESASNAYCELSAAVNHAAGLILGSNAYTNAANITDQFDGVNHFLQLSANAPGSYVTVRCAGLERVRVANGGQVGIGTSAPDRSLTVIGPSSGVAGTTSQFKVLNSAGSGLAVLAFSPGNNNLTIGADYNGSNWVALDTSAVLFQQLAIAFNIQIATGLTVGGPVSFTSAISILGNGNVGIGVSSPGCALDCNGLIRSVNYAAPASGKGLELAYFPGNTNGYVQAFDRNANAYLELNVAGSPIQLNQAGAGTGVGIGMSAPPAYSFQLGADSAAKPSTSTWTISSDVRVKRNIKELEGGMSVIAALRPVESEYNGEDGTAAGLRVVSFLAHEVREVLPHCVTSHRGKLDEQETDVLDLNMHEILMHLILAVQQLSKRGLLDGRERRGELPFG